MIDWRFYLRIIFEYQLCWWLILRILRLWILKNILCDSNSLIKECIMNKHIFWRNQEERITKLYEEYLEDYIQSYNGNTN